MRTIPKYSVPGALAAFLLCAAGDIHAGPPYVTDDPETVEPHHWEIDLALQQYHTADGWNGTVPQLELDYGLMEDVQLHVIGLSSYNRSPGEPAHFGAGDTELGIKYRFIHESDSMPQVGIFPLVEVPSGNLAEGLGNGKAQVFVPVWLQKSIGPWTTYGGGGYWFNPGPDNHNYWYAGWLVQRKLTESFAPGLEIQFRSSQTAGSRPSTALNAGGTWDLNDTYHVLFSAGHTVEGRSEFQGYLALQITLGPKEKDPSKK